MLLKLINGYLIVWRSVVELVQKYALGVTKYRWITSNGISSATKCRWTTSTGPCRPAKCCWTTSTGPCRPAKCRWTTSTGTCRPTKYRWTTSTALCQCDVVFLKNCTKTLFCAIFALKSPVFTVLNGSSLQYRLKYNASLMVLIATGCAYWLLRCIVFHTALLCWRDCGDELRMQYFPPSVWGLVVGVVQGFRVHRIRFAHWVGHW